MELCRKTMSDPSPSALHTSVAGGLRLPINTYFITCWALLNAPAPACVYALLPWRMPLLQLDIIGISICKKLNGLTFFKTNEHSFAQLVNAPTFAFVISFFFLGRGGDVWGCEVSWGEREGWFARNTLFQIKRHEIHIWVSLNNFLHQKIP